MKHSFMKRLMALALVIVSLFSVTAMAAAETKYVDVPQGPGYTVNIRKTASTSGTKLGAITYGSAVTVVGTSGDWTQIQCYDASNGKTYGESSDAFIKTEFLSSSISSDCYWIVRYGTIDHRYTNSVKNGCAALQEDLNEVLGLDLSTDGICGNATVAAIKDFQRQYNLTVDGIAGNRTKEYLYKVTH